MNKKSRSNGRITGPWDGVFIAAYTVELDGVFYGYAKLCTEQPLDVWTARPISKISSGASYPTRDAALAAVENRAFRVISSLRASVNKGLGVAWLAGQGRRPAA